MRPAINSKRKGHWRCGKNATSSDKTRRVETSRFCCILFVIHLNKNLVSIRELFITAVIITVSCKRQAGVDCILQCILTTKQLAGPGSAWSGPEKGPEMLLLFIRGGGESLQTFSGMYLYEEYRSLTVPWWGLMLCKEMRRKSKGMFSVSACLSSFRRS